MVHPSRLVSAVLAILGATLGACTETGSPVSRDTRITPDVFQYATIIEAPTDGTTGGWRAVCVKVRLGGRGEPTPGETRSPGAECGLEFGTPIVNHQHGHIPLHKAQRISADVANKVGRRVLEEEGGITSTLCSKLRRAMNKDIDEAIKGSKVDQCGVTQWSDRVPEVTWTPPN